MKARIIQGVKIACENWLDGTMDFESAAKFIKSYADDPAVDVKIALETMSYFRATGDLEKTKEVIMEMRQVQFERLQAKKEKKAFASLTRPDIPGFIEKDL